MFKRSYVMALDNESMVDMLTKIAANHHLYTQYKIGVYGKIHQHELFITGHFWDYYSFKNEIASISK